jgi:hypothetical protein
MHPWFVPSNSLVTPIFSFICIPSEMLQGQTHSVHFFSILRFSGPHCAHTFWNFKRSCIMPYAKPWEHPSAVATLPIVILLSAWINSSTRCTVASVTISTGWPGRGIICIFWQSWKEFLDPVVNHSTRQTLPTVNRTYFFINTFALSPFVHKNMHKRMLLKHGHHSDYWNQPLNMCMCGCYLDCH